jgi:hypothetical protein
LLKIILFLPESYQKKCRSQSVTFGVAATVAILECVDDEQEQ